MSETFQQRSSNVDEASYEIASFSAKNKKSHNIGECFVKPGIIVAADDGGVKRAIMAKVRRGTKKVKNYWVKR